jgi:hypothetical protein
VIHIEGRWQPEDRAASVYQYVPVEPPPGSGAFTVDLAYDRAAAVIDLGCLDPTGAFRGWSGAARDGFTVTGEWATPGYLPGPIPDGFWQVVMGLHRVPPEGIAWRLTATNAMPPAPAVPPAEPMPQWPRPGRRLPAPPGHRWLAGDLHAHSVHSDGTLTVAELARLAAGSGLDFLAITDHNTVSHHPSLPAESAILLVPGQEITTERGHANAYGDIGWVDFRRPAEEWLSTVESRGGLLSVNHPLAADCAWLHPLAGRPPLVELWHSGWWDRTWTAPLAWLLAFHPDATPIGGSDFHQPGGGAPPGAPTTWVLCPVADPREASVAMVLDGLRAGRVAISESPTGPALVRVGPDEFVAVDADGALFTGYAGRRQVVRGDRAAFPAAPGPHWLEDHRAQVLAVAA